MTYFHQEAGKVASVTHQSQYEARTSLINELYLKRLKAFAPRKILSMALHNDSWLRTRITYSRKGLINQHLKEVKKLANQDVEELVDVLPMISEYDIGQAVRVVPLIFSNDRTKGFIQTTLQHGELEARDKYHLSKRQFNRKVNDISRYCSKHRGEIRQFIPNTEKQQLLANRLKKLKTMLLLINRDDDYSVQQLMYSDCKFWEDTIGEIPQVQYQYYLLHDYSHSEDKTAFISYINEQINQLEEQLRG